MNRPKPRPAPSRQRFGGFGALIDRVAVRIGKLSKLEVRLVVDVFGDELFGEVRTKGHITWPGRGSFRKTKRKARNVANPQTGEKMRLPRAIGIGFRASKAEKERLADGA